MFGIGKSPVMVDFEGSTVKGITKKDLKTLSQGYGLSEGFNKVSGLAKDLAEALPDFYENVFGVQDVDTARDVVANLKMFATTIRVHQGDPPEEIELKEGLINALEASVQALTKCVVDLSKQQTPALPQELGEIVRSVSALPQSFHHSETKIHEDDEDKKPQGLDVASTSGLKDQDKVIDEQPVSSPAQVDQEKPSGYGRHMNLLLDELVKQDAPESVIQFFQKA